MYRSGRAAPARPGASPAGRAHDLRVADVGTDAESVRVIEQLLDPAPSARDELQRGVDGVLLRGGAQLLGGEGGCLAVQGDHGLHVYESTATDIHTATSSSDGIRFTWTTELVRIALAVDERDAAEQAARLADEDVQLERLPLRVCAAGGCRGLG